MKRLVVHYAIAGLIAYTGLCTWLFLAQDKLLYLPTPEVSAQNANVITLESGTETLKIWKVGTGSKAVLYFGGNGEDVAGNIDHFAGMVRDTTFYLMNYRGYGGSSGKPSEAALKEDALLLYDKVSRAHEQVSVIGRSLGSGVATLVASQREVWKLVLVSPFDSIEEVASNEYPFAPVSLLLRDKYRSIDYAPGISAPLLVILADVDNVVPHHHSMNLVSQFPIDQVKVRIVLGSNHNTISQADDYYALMQQFLYEEPVEPETAEPVIANNSE